MRTASSIGTASLHLESVAQRPGEIGELVGEPLGERPIAVGDDDRRPAALGDVEPGLHRIVRRLQHARVRLHGARAVEPGLHRPLRGQELLLVREQRDLAPGRDRLQPRRAMMRSSSSVPILPVSNGSCGCVRCADDGVDALDHLLRDVGVVIEPEHDRDVRPEDLAAERGLLALDVVDALGRAGAVQLQRQPVDPAPRRFEPAADLVVKIVVRGALIRPPATAQARMIGTISMASPDSSAALMKPPIWPRPRSFSKISGPSKIPNAS